MKYMVFVDGSNLLEQLGVAIGRKIRAEKPRDEEVEVATELVAGACRPIGMAVGLIRQYWFGSFLGDDDFHDHLADLLRRRGFEPVLIKRRDPNREKGVDVQLTKEMLVNAFHHNYDLAYLVAGDEDYLSLVQETKRFGPIVRGAFLPSGLSPVLRRSFDHFAPMEHEVQNFKETIGRLRAAPEGATR